MLSKDIHCKYICLSTSRKCYIVFFKKHFEFVVKQVQPDDPTIDVTLPNIKKDIVPGNKIKLIITPVSDVATPVVKDVTVKICRKGNFLMFCKIIS